MALDGVKRPINFIYSLHRAAQCVIFPASFPPMGKENSAAAEKSLNLIRRRLCDPTFVFRPLSASSDSNYRFWFCPFKNLTIGLLLPSKYVCLASWSSLYRPLSRRAATIPSCFWALAALENLLYAPPTINFFYCLSPFSWPLITCDFQVLDLVVGDLLEEYPDSLSIVCMISIVSTFRIIHLHLHLTITFCDADQIEWPLA